MSLLYTDAMSDGRCKWIGGSGKRYEYAVYRIPSHFTDDQFGNYIFARRNARGKWVPIYIGEGELSPICTAENPKWEAIRRRGATHVHCHLRKDLLHRLDEQEDLLARYVNAYEPHGCNEPVVSPDWPVVDVSFVDFGPVEPVRSPLNDAAEISLSSTGTDMANSGSGTIGMSGSIGMSDTGSGMQR